MCTESLLRRSIVMAGEMRPEDSADAPAPARPRQAGDAVEIETFVDAAEVKTAPRMSVRQRPDDATADIREFRHSPRWGELLGILCLVALCDVTIYRGDGFAGYALLFSAGPILLWLSSSRRFGGPALWTVWILLAALSVKLLWCGSNALVVIGGGLVVAFAMALAGHCPYVLEALFFASRTLHAGYLALIDYARGINDLGPAIPKSSWISAALPALAVAVFGWIFILANPDLSNWVGEGIAQVFDTLQRWIRQFSPDLLEVGFWLAVAWIAGGLLRPVADRVATGSSSNGARHDDEAPRAQAFLYPAFRNTLATVIVLFAVYLVFEFKTLWFRDFPRGFYYSGYAHEGAAWLTAALALATVVLSLGFRGSILRDPRLGVLRRLAWVWSIENVILAVAVFNRLFIYVGFNGMTRMRIVALYGISAVVVGFALVVWKIVHNHKFGWLVRRQLWALALAIYLLAMTPLDAIVVRYNVRRILAGDPAPSVQISVHPINAEGILRLTPLLESDDEVIREGVRALLAEYHLEAEANETRRQSLNWTAYQAADHIALEGLRRKSDLWERYRRADDRLSALERFHKYAYQWY
jgi:hypothetical protein